MSEQSDSPLPAGLVHYRSTPVFSEATVPAGLLADHSTKPGVWGLIVVRSGALRYRITDLRRPPTTVELAAGEAPGIVEPTISHHVEAMGAVEFQIEFYR